MVKLTLTKWEQKWYYWHLKTATDNGLSFNQARDLAVQAVKSVRKYG